MLNNANFLCEIGTEEIPAGYLPPAIESIEKTFREQLADKRIDFDSILVMATPRRLAILVSGLSDKQRAEEVELKGPAVSASYEADGKPAKPLLGFLKGNDVTEKDLFKKDLGKGEYVFAKKMLSSKSTLEIIPNIIKTIVNEVPFPKRMRWSDKTLSFPRPIDYFAIMFNDVVVPFEFEGIPSSNKVRGHYIRYNKMIQITKIADYESLLRQNGVIVNHVERKEAIHAALHKAAADAGCVLHDDEDLLNVITFIVEDPYAVICSFNKEFLEVPDIALIAEMKEHQKYFPLHTNEDKLSDKFLVVSNNPPTPFIKAGNERVISARFSDARFFYTEDRKKSLSDLVESLKTVLFHKELGSIYDKVQRMQKIAVSVADMLGLDSAVKAKIDRALLLCKADLNTAMVFEFASLQGKMGRIYALEDGEDAEVAAAIEDHYKPRSQDDEIPSGMVSFTASISEKLDNIFGSFSVGNIPKGSADPYALRRQANAIVEMLIQNDLKVSLRSLFEKIAPVYKDGEKLVDQILEFVTARVKTIFADKNLRHDEIDACLSTGESDFTELFRRAHSLNEFRKDEKFSEMLLSFKRMNNILSGFRKDNKDYALKFDAALLQENEEKALFEFFNQRSSQIRELISQSKYIQLFELLIQGKTAIDAFFDKVLVMDERINVRDTRLAMLEGILTDFTGLLDFSKISEK